MKITKIEVQNYKSIKEPIEINFYNGLPTVLIGKNGSGKTNILEALNAIAEANGSYFGLDSKLTLSYKLHISLSEEDITLLFPGKDIDEDKCQFIACSGEKCNIDRIESEYLVPLLKSEICEINRLANELKEALDTYAKQLNKAACNEINEISARGFQITNFQNSSTNYATLKFQVESVLEQAERFAESLIHSFKSYDNSFQFGYVSEYYGLGHWEKLPFKLHYVKPDLAPFEEKFITINETALKREITKINKRTKECCDRISMLIRTLDERSKRLKDALTDGPIPRNEAAFYGFIREMKKCIGSRFSFLRNESSDVIFQSDDRERENYNQYYRMNKSFVVLQTYLNKVYKGADKEELLKQIQHGKDFSLPDAALGEFEQYLNENIPEFEKDMYNRILVERSGVNIPTILLHEKGGETVSLNETSAGRRWYFTYYFIKNTLAPGDLFIIDEPAAMLHPIAQKEILNELLDLEKQGIKVVFSTHSPYLIPSSWECVHFVAMSNVGTSVTQENQYALFKQFIGGDIFSLQELVEKYQRCDKESTAKRCYDVIRDKFNSIETAAAQLKLSVSTIESWRKGIDSKKFRSPKLENVLLIAEKTNTDIFEILQ